MKKYVVIVLLSLLGLFIIFVLLTGLSYVLFCIAPQSAQRILLDNIDILNKNIRRVRFKCPRYDKIYKFAIEIMDNSGGDQIGEVQSALEFKITIRDEGYIILCDELFTKEKFKYDNHHEPNTAIVLYDRELLNEKLLKENNCYYLDMEIVHPDNLFTGRKAELYLWYSPPPPLNFFYKLIWEPVLGR
jgi:hypothetical protein